ncbi:MAG: hypothetical protein LBT10_01840 [Methanobrevibacter sp.]|jgi:hypothetical protein|nr:hypothetical protein [Methanobrevibacter sp.]
MSWKSDLNAKFTQGSILHAADLNTLVNAVPMSQKTGGVVSTWGQLVLPVNATNFVYTIGGDATQYYLQVVNVSDQTIVSQTAGNYQSGSDVTLFGSPITDDDLSTCWYQIGPSATVGSPAPSPVLIIQLIQGSDGIQFKRMTPSQPFASNLEVHPINKGGIGLQTSSGDNAMFIRLKNYEDYDLTGLHLGFMTKNRRRGSISQTSGFGSVNRWTLSTAMNRDGTGTPISGRKQWLRALNQSWYTIPEDLNSWLGIDFSQFIGTSNISDINNNTLIHQPAGQTIGSVVEVRGLTSKFINNNTSSNSKLIYMNIPTKLVLYKYKELGDNKPYDIYAEHDGVFKLEFEVTFGMGGAVSTAVFNGKVKFAPK